MASIPALPVLEDFIKHGVPLVHKDEIAAGRDGYQAYLTRCQVLDTEFRFGEIVDARQGDKQMPRANLWRRMPMTLACVQLLRELWGRPLTVIAAFRPGNVGASNSQHKVNSALDVDFFDDDATDDSAEMRALYEVAVKLWSDFGVLTKMGFGLYTAGPRSLGGRRVHIDTGWRGRTWQGVAGGGFQKPWTVEGRDATLSVKLAFEHGWDVPTRDDI